MSKFNAEIKALEQQVKKYQEQLQGLHDENASLKEREEGLCRSLVTLQCGMTALASASSQPSSQDQDSSCMTAGEGGPWGQTPLSTTSSMQATTGRESPAVYSDLRQPSASNQHQSAPSQEARAPACPAAAARPPSFTGMSDSSATSIRSGLLQQTQQQQQQPPPPPPQQQQQQQLKSAEVARVEQQLQTLLVMLEGAMQQVGSLAPSQAPLQGPPPAADAAMYGRDASGSVPHPTTHVSVLRVLAADPQRVLAYLALTTEERSRWLAAAVRRLSLLLPKYDAMPTCRAEAVQLTQEIVMRGLTYTWLDPDLPVMVQLQLLNMETGQLEAAYPEGFWEFVAQSIGFSPQQRQALQALFCRIKAAQADLLAEHEALLAQLQGMQQQQQQQQQLFAHEAQQLPILRTAQALGRSRQEQQQQQERPQQQQQQQPLQRQVSPGSAGLVDRLAGVGLAGGPSQPAQVAIKQEPQEQPQQQQQPQLQQQPLSQQHEPQLLLDPLLASADPCLDVLLSPPCHEQQRLEAQLSSLRDRVAMGEQLLASQLMTMLSPKQLAQLVVASWPFCPDSMAVAEVVAGMT